MKMISKKAQGEIITTVLIILLVLAAIVIVWQVVNGTVNKAGGQAQTASDCMNTGLSITSVTNDSSKVLVTVNKDSTGTVLATTGKILVYKNDGTQACTSTDIVQGAFPSTTLSQSQANVTCTVTAGNTYTVKIAPKLGTNQCDVVSSFTLSI